LYKTISLYITEQSQEYWAQYYIVEPTMEKPIPLPLEFGTTLDQWKIQPLQSGLPKGFLGEEACKIERYNFYGSRVIYLQTSVETIIGEDYNQTEIPSKSIGELKLLMEPDLFWAQSVYILELELNSTFLINLNCNHEKNSLPYPFRMELQHLYSTDLQRHIQ
jgi:hypothetical protein